MRKYFKLIRVKHYIKNLLIFFPLFFSSRFRDIFFVKNTLWETISFCSIASIVYIVNDIVDIEKDRLHPTKCNRPLASGQITKRKAIYIAFLLLIISIGINVINHLSVWGWLIQALYIILNLGYSILRWKDCPIWDICILASGFVIRIYFGAIINNIEISEWLFLTVLVFSLYFSFGKRCNELKRSKECQTRNVLKYYTQNYLEKNMYVSLTLGIVFYTLWGLNVNRGMIFITVPMVLFIVFRYNLLLETDSEGDPVEVILNDKFLLLLCFIYGCTITAILYFM